MVHRDAIGHSYPRLQISNVTLTPRPLRALSRPIPPLLSLVYHLKCPDACFRLNLVLESSINFNSTSHKILSGMNWDGHKSVQWAATGGTVACYSVTTYSVTNVVCAKDNQGQNIAQTMYVRMYPYCCVIAPESTDH